ncbi:MAG: hypothetical protein M9942_04860 [Microthrixaceae bacterium]|nr:hypothetical protein [Microthrixaceae bacterium]
MSTQVLDRVSDIQEQVIELLSSVKEPVTRAVDSVVTLVTDRVEVPAVPFAEEIPTPKEIIDNQAKFASKVVSTNKSTALAAARAAAPLTDALLDRKPARKASSTKAAA